MLLTIIVIVCFAALFMSYRNDGPTPLVWTILGIVLLVALLKALGLF